MTARNRKRLYCIAAAAGALIAFGPLAYDRLYPLSTRYSSEVEHFKYGSIGVEPASGIPFEIWRVLPGLCMAPAAAKLGYRQFGFQWEPGHAAPVGMPVEKALVTRVGVNCAMCHVGRVEDDAGRSRLLPGAPNTQLDLQAYLRFLSSCAASDRFTSANIVTQMRRHRSLSLPQELLYRWLIIPQVRKALIEQQRQLAFMAAQPDWLPGRASGFNPAKIQVLKHPFDGTLDIVDIPSLWRMRDREPGAFHWDGANTSLREVFLNSGTGNGASARSIDVVSLERDLAWARRVPAARYPFGIQAPLAQQGAGIFARACADCHAPTGAKVNQVIPIGWVGTDRNRLDAMTDETVGGFAAKADYRWKYEHFRKTDGYVAAPLNGLWARAPYLHNGSVPTLDALLRPPPQRPVVFARGSARYDRARVGFASDRGRAYDTRLPGNSASGHLWGTDLSDTERRALLEYLKTL